jgi:glycosyltransferase involved in cell wall biosynthesis
VGGPAVSICIPTFARADLLEPLLATLLPEAAALEGALEVVVSDNCSNDRTPDVLDGATRLGPLRWSRADENAGAVRNLLRAVECARGEFCLAIGDDDLVLTGGSRRLVALAHEHRELDGLYLNAYVSAVEHRDRLVEHGSVWTPEAEPLFDSQTWCADRTDHPVDRWQDLLAAEGILPPCQFQAMQTLLFRRSAWMAHVGMLDLDGGREYTTLDNTYPHAKVLAYALFGKPSYYVGDPVVVIALGRQHWHGEMPYVISQVVFEALDLYDEIGADRAVTRDLRRQFTGSRLLRTPLEHLIFGESRSGREDFSLPAFIWRSRRQWRYIGRVLAAIVAGRAVKGAQRLDQRARPAVRRLLPSPLYRALRAAYRALRRLGRSLQSRG